MADGDTLSSIFGWISISCWMIVYSPQLYENYSLQSGEGLSILLLLAWVIGDLCNLAGAILGRLVPTVILLAIYYMSADLALLGQVYYYRWKRRYDGHLTDTTVLDGHTRGSEEEPLLGGSQARTKTVERESLSKLAVRYALCLLFVCASGIGAWWIDERKHQSGPPKGDMISNLPGGEAGDTSRAWVVQILGWTSAILYVGSSFPQILKNMETKCEGLSPPLFLFAIFGGFTYILSICAKSMDKGYLIVNASWLIANTLTCLLDGVIVGQIIYYRFT